MLIHGIDPSRVKAAVFDLGGVFLAGGVESVRSFGQRHVLTPEIWQLLRDELFSDDGMWAAIERGERPLLDFLVHMQRQIAGRGVEISLEDARQFMGNGDPSAATSRVRREIVAAAERIRRRMPTALLTNNIAEWRPAWRAAIDVERLFDVVVDSSEVGTRKPEPRIYELTRERLGLAHAELFFLDDLGPNLKVARSLGWQTLKYDDTARVLEVLEALGNFGAREL